MSVFIVDLVIGCLFVGGLLYCVFGKFKPKLSKKKKRAKLYTNRILT